jgi:hypothetical protein
MAALTATFVEGGVLQQPVPIGGLHLEVWRIQGGAVGDTATITPRRGRYVVSALSGHATTTSLSTAGTDTSVTFTLTASASPSVTFDAWLLVSE